MTSESAICRDAHFLKQCENRRKPLADFHQHDDVMRLDGSPQLRPFVRTRKDHKMLLAFSEMKFRRARNRTIAGHARISSVPQLRQAILQCRQCVSVSRVSEWIA